ncbi:hypothetical protein J2X77_004811 [Sphingobacterium sp. 2149]|nr:hypothetical protein [Sphingobacterium sp. 2149]
MNLKIALSDERLEKEHLQSIIPLSAKSHSHWEAVTE